MKTKFILHGGFEPNTKQENDAFFQEILSTAPKEPRILLVYFAKKPDRVEKNRAEDIDQFNKNKGDRTLSFETANEKDFLGQVRSADVVYLHGGHSGLMLEAMKKWSGFKGLFEGKIVAGDSAGANALSTIFYSDTIGIAEGLGVLPIKIICHYTEEKKDTLEKVRPELETIRLPQYQFRVIEEER